ncbi:mannose-1-phosphate guanylyltransferase/mannose-6-phosphate isomerase [Constrictibacter sp. MBR-5]|jgi:mannose-1-phosphate guanylyltransferase/mannose-6-phosphate isomerase|uniref:mannose-1-phosphate guanylyltransferase/mannose-6-phosphate isomerase n=1 Tax=Constrictibacter sp. MBR-5 TaxID=3156467 RepID=UPI00339436C0
MPDTIDRFGDSRITPVLLSSDSSSRLWPLARQSYPSQFMSLSREGSNIQHVAGLVADPALYRKPVVVCGDDQRFFVADHLRGRGARIILEAVTRDTALPIGVAALHVAATDPEGVLLVLSANHQIAGKPAFAKAVETATRAARAGWMVTLGVPPIWPERDYGYVLSGEAIPGVEGADAIACFVEKPDGECAAKFLGDGRYLWNTGILIATASTVLDQLGVYAPEALDAARDAYEGGVEDLDFFRLDQAASVRAPAVSFQTAVFQSCARNALVKADLEWSDFGSWGALWRRQQRDDRGNVTSGDIVCADVERSYLHSDDMLVAALGVRNLVVIATGDALLVADRDRMSEVEDLVVRLKAEGRQEAFEHKRVYRPWGYYESISSGSRYQVKKLCVKPGGKLSLQSHNHRAEHWTCVSGTAIVTIDGNRQIFGENESTYIPLGAVHRLENPGKIDLMIIEVQSGSYLGEDDIIRYEDIYARTASSQLTPVR